MHEAEAGLDTLPPPEELPPSSYWYTPAVLLGHKGFVLAGVGEHTAAQRAAVESLAEMPREWRTAEWAAQHRQLANT